MIIKKSKSNNLHSWLRPDGSLIPLFHEIKDRFPKFARQYFAGMWDGDGYQTNALGTKKRSKYKRLKLTLELANDGCEPVLKLSEIFDLSLSYSKRKGEKYKNHQPTYKVHLGGPKAEMFMLLIYPYLIEDRPIIRKILLERGVPEKYLKDPMTFSWAYLAGYADAEGNYFMALHHKKYKKKKGYGISSHYNFRFQLSSNDFASLTFIKNKIMDQGFKFRKDEVKHYNNRKPKEGSNPKNWRPTLAISMGGGPLELSRLYKNIYMYSLINKKKATMERTISYSSLIYRDETK